MVLLGMSTTNEKIKNTKLCYIDYTLLKKTVSMFGVD